MATSPRTDLPNVIIILADDLGFGDLGAYGNPDVQTPHLDQLAADGVRFTQHYSASPICAPARAALLTGRYNHRTGAIDVPSNRGLDRIALRERTIADHFRDAGYTTGMIGKWHNGLHDMQYHPNARGFDEFTGFLNGGMDYWKWVLDRNGQAHRSDGRYLTDVFSDLAVSFIRRHKKQPFFLYVAYNTPHAPLQAPEEDVAPFIASGKFNKAVSTLHGMVRRMDAGIGRIMETLKAEGMHRDTIVLFTSDNGPWMGNERLDGKVHSMQRFNGPFRGMKQDVLEGGIRVPAILSCPGSLQAGRQCEYVIHFVDWLSTIFSLAGAPLRPALPLDGRDATYVIKGEGNQTSPNRYWQWNRYDPVSRCNAAVRDGKWKLYWARIPEAMAKDPEDSKWYVRGLTEPHALMDVGNPHVHRDLPSPPRPMLFDIEADPGELRDLVSRFPAKTEALTRKWLHWFENVERDRMEAQPWN